jgi:hypothetical protein
MAILAVGAQHGGKPCARARALPLYRTQKELFMTQAFAHPIRAHVPDVPQPMPPVAPPLPGYPPATPPETPTELPPDIREPEVPDEQTPPAGDPPRQPSPIVSRH